MISLVLSALLRRSAMPRFAPRVGAVMRWNISYSSHVAVGNGKLGTAVDLEGELEGHVVGILDGMTLVSYRLRDVRRIAYVLGGVEVRDARRLLEGTTVLAEIATDGRLGAVRGAPGVSELARNVLAAFLEDSQVLLPDNDSLSWASDEETALGCARSRTYVRGRSGATQQLARDRQRYATLRALTWRNSAPPSQELHHHLDATFDAVAGLFTHVTVDETLRAFAGPQVLMRGETELALALIGTDTAPVPERLL